MCVRFESGADKSCVAPGARTRQLSDMQIQQILLLSRAATNPDLISYTFRDMGNADLVQAVHTRSAAAAATLASGIMTEEVWGSLPPLVDSLTAALDASAVVEHNTHFRDLIISGDSSGSDDADSSEEEEDVSGGVDQMYTLARELFAKIISGSVETLMVSTSLAVLHI